MGFAALSWSKWDHIPLAAFGILLMRRNKNADLTSQRSFWFYSHKPIHRYQTTGRSLAVLPEGVMGWAGRGRGEYAGLTFGSRAGLGGAIVRFFGLECVFNLNDLRDFCFCSKMLADGIRSHWAGHTIKFNFCRTSWNENKWSIEWFESPKRRRQSTESWRNRLRQIYFENVDARVKLNAGW